ncbi:hypothetical protein JXB01_02250 [Candidatus Micrarchaeota archaeon]|nr:hypothetical protein [Candidatus Micrarchaeota archaeon]
MVDDGGKAKGVGSTSLAFDLEHGKAAKNLKGQRAKSEELGKSVCKAFLTNNKDWNKIVDNFWKSNSLQFDKYMDGLIEQNGYEKVLTGYAKDAFKSELKKQLFEKTFLTKIVNGYVKKGKMPKKEEIMASFTKWGNFKLGNKTWKEFLKENEGISKKMAGEVIEVCEIESFKKEAETAKKAKKGFKIKAEVKADGKTEFSISNKKIGKNWGENKFNIVTTAKEKNISKKQVIKALEQYLKEQYKGDLAVINNSKEIAGKMYNELYKQYQKELAEIKNAKKKGKEHKTMVSKAGNTLQDLTTIGKKKSWKTEMIATGL